VKAILRTRWGGPLLTGAWLISFACGGGTGDAGEGDAGARTDSAGAAAGDSTRPSGTPSGEPITATLEPVNESGVEGQATAIHVRDSLQLNLMVQGLPSEGEYAAQVHRGSCEAGGPVAFSLTPVRSDGDGLGRSSTALDPTSLTEGESYFVQVQQGAKPLACGDVPGS
jgi:hypothetical protein